ncbi:D-glycero-alpha-D-manno-heptose 7-phosphate kinase [Halioglobus japonicus]|nr:D-glycero-alpha-D-manno-heptose 7-phosphate kinase [Halioglobus japonicus]
MLIRSKAPLRLGLAGGGSDVAPYCDLYGGAVLNASINLSSYCTIEPLTDGTVTFVATDRQEIFTAPSAPSYSYDGLLDLHKGVYNRIVRDFNDGEPLSLKISTHSDAPAGSGLGSSSTMVVAILTAFAELLHLPLGEYDVAHLAFEIEREDIGLRGGAQDQYAATFGGVNFMEFHEKNRVTVNPLRIKKWILSELEASTVLYYTGVSRSSDMIIAQQIESFKSGQGKSVEAVHQLKQDASAMKDALLRGNIRRFGEILGRSWEAKRNLADKISNPQIEEVMRIALEAGAWAGKVSGAGGGGFIVFIVDPVERVQLIRALNQQDGDVVPFQFEPHGASAWNVPT